MKRDKWDRWPWPQSGDWDNDRWEQFRYWRQNMDEVLDTWIPQQAKKDIDATKTGN